MPHGWPGRVLAGAVAGFIVGVILAVVSGTHTHGVVGTVAGFLILLAPAAVCVALPAALYRRYRSRRAAGPRSPLGISTAPIPQRHATGPGRTRRHSGIPAHGLVLPSGPTSEAPPLTAEVDGSACLPGRPG